MMDPKTLATLPDDAVERTEFTDTLVPITRLAESMLAAGRRAGFKGVTFTRCLIQGPGVIVPGGDTHFDRCMMGNVQGDVRNLFLLAVGPLITGAIPVDQCLFVECEFKGVGFAGEQPFVDSFVQGLSRNSGAAQ